MWPPMATVVLVLTVWVLGSFSAAALIASLSLRGHKRSAIDRRPQGASRRSHTFLNPSG